MLRQDKIKLLLRMWLAFFYRVSIQENLIEMSILDIKAIDNRQFSFFRSEAYKPSSLRVPTHHYVAAFALAQVKLLFQETDYLHAELAHRSLGSEAQEHFF